MKKRLTESNPFSNLINCPSLTLPFGKGNFFLISFLLLIFTENIFSQDTTKAKVKVSSPSGRSGGATHSPRKAMIFSMVVPGLGQAYNKKYWKIPIIYASAGATIYMFQFNDKNYKKYKQAYIDTNLVVDGIEKPYISIEQLRTQAEFHRRYRDLSVILTGLLYTLNIVDAYVDAQLTTFDISDNLSMTILPAMNLSAQRKNPAMGLTLSVKF